MARTRTITPDEMASLTADVRAGGRRKEKALARLLEAHEPIIRVAGLKIAKAGVETDDAMQTARLMAWRALLRWDPDAGASPGTWIAHALRPGNAHELVLTMRPAPVRPPMTSAWKQTARRWNDILSAFRAARGRDPEPAEVEVLCRRAGLDPAVVESIARLAAPAVPLDAPLRGREGDEGGATIADTLAAEGGEEDEIIGRLDDATRRARLVEALERLPARDADVLRARFGVGGVGEAQQLDAIAARLGVSKERVRQIVDRAMVRLRAEMTGQAKAEAAASIATWAPAIDPIDLAKAIQAGLPGIGEDAPLLRPAAARARPAGPPAPRRRRARPQDPRQACLLAWVVAGAVGSISLAA